MRLEFLMVEWVGANALFIIGILSFILMILLITGDDENDFY